MPKYKGLVISDIHVGAMNLDKLYNEYKEIFIEKIYRMKFLDFLIIAGDFFDHKFYLNDREAAVSYKMLKDLVLACKEKEAVIRIVYGTESHECNQYDILSLLKIYDKIEVVKYAKEEELLPGLNVLYLPEEHLDDKDEYYKEFFSNKNKYSYVFGHGVIREVMHDVVVHMENKPNENKRKKVPIFNSAELSNICKGQVFFGHYHLNQEINNKIFSISSFSRWKFGEEGRKGFYELTCNTDKDKYEYEFIENTMADTYKTISFGYNDEVFNNDETMINTLNEMDALVNRDVYNHLRFVFNIPSTIENPEASINYIKERYKYSDNIKVEMVHGYIEEKRKIQKEQVEKENEKYSFIFDKSLPLEDKVSQFIFITYNKNIKPERVSDYLYKQLIDFL